MSGGTITLALARLLALVAAAAVAACAESNVQEGPAAAAAPSATAPAGVSATTAQAPAPAPPAAPRPTAAGRNMHPPSRQPTTPVPPGQVYTIQTARAECWMEFESDKKAPRDLEQRAKLVEACAAEKMAALAAGKAP